MAKHEFLELTHIGQSIIIARDAISSIVPLVAYSSVTLKEIDATGKNKNYVVVESFATIRQLLNHRFTEPT